MVRFLLTVGSWCLNYEFDGSVVITYVGSPVHGVTMGGRGSAVVEQFKEAVPQRFLAAMPSAIRDAYGEALKYSAKFERAEAHDIRRLVQRVLIEEALRVHAERNGLTAKPRLNRAKNCYHRYVQAPPFSLTQSFVRDINQPVRRAHFRNGYASSSQIDWLVQDEPMPIRFVYGIMLHGPHPERPAEPGFVQVRFPVRDATNYLPDTVDLLKSHGFSHSVEMIPQEEIRDQVEVAIAQHFKQKEASDG